MLTPEHQGPPVRHPALESMASGVELTLASVLQGIPLAILVPGVVELILSADLARLIYAPASLLLVFMVWVVFILYAISFVAWPFDPLHNLIYFAVVGAEAVLLDLIDRPGVWFVALIGFAIALGLNFAYNHRTLARQAPLFTGTAGRALHAHMLAEHEQGLRFVAAYAAAGVLGAAIVPILERIGVNQGLVWGAAGVGAVLVPLVHVRWLLGLVRDRSRLIEQAHAEQG